MLFGLIKDKCTYCRTPIERGREFQAAVKVPGMIGTFEKKFCSSDHINAYRKELKDRPKRGASCCN